jgi:hypothetical protein
MANVSSVGYETDMRSTRGMQLSGNGLIRLLFYHDPSGVFLSIVTSSPECGILALHKSTPHPYSSFRQT